MPSAFAVHLKPSQHCYLSFLQYKINSIQLSSLKVFWTLWFCLRKHSGSSSVRVYNLVKWQHLSSLGGRGHCQKSEALTTGGRGEQLGVRELQLQSLVPAVGEHGGFSSARYPGSLEGPHVTKKGAGGRLRGRERGAPSKHCPPLRTWKQTWDKLSGLASEESESESNGLAKLTANRTEALKLTFGLTPAMLGKIESRRRGWQRMRWLDGITNSVWANSGSLTRVWANSGRWWRTGNLVCCSPSGRTWGHDRVTEHQPPKLISLLPDSVPQTIQVVSDVSPLQTGLQWTFSLKVICHSSSQLNSAFNLHPFSAC